MKDILFIDSILHHQFRSEVINNVNYLQNRLPLIKYIVNKTIIIPKEIWTKIRQNFKDVQIFSSKVSTHISF